MAARPRARKPATKRPMRRGPGVVGSILILLAVAALCGLGKWQYDKVGWKTRLLARIASLQTAPAEPLNVVFNRVADGGAVDFVRVVARCERLGDKSVFLYGLRTAGPGWRQIAACTLASGPYGTVLVDLGFQSQAGGAGGESGSMPAPAAVAVTLPAEGAMLQGVLRAPEPKPWFASLVAPPPAKRGEHGEFFARDIPAMASALDAPRPAPVMLTLESPAAAPGLTPSPLPTDIPNRHFEYALTWFGLAAALVAVWLASLIRAWRRP